MNRGANRTARRGLDGLRARAFARAKLTIPLLDSVVPTKGSAPMSFTRASVRRELDYSGLFVELLSGEVGFRGARRVRNRVATSTDMSNAVWLVHAGCTKTGGQADPDGGTSAVKVVTDVGSKGIYQTAGDGSAIGETIVQSIWLRADAPITLSIDRATGGTPSATVFVTTEWKRFSVAGVVNAGPTQGLYIRALSATTFYCCKPQVEDVTGQSNQNPGEYVPVGAAKLNEFINTESLDLWGTSGGASTITANSTVAPNGSLSADTFKSDSGSSDSRVTDFAGLVPSTSYTLKFRVKQGTAGKNAMGLYSTTLAGFVGYVRWVWTAGVPSTDTTLGSPTNITYTDLGGGWWEVSIDAVTHSAGAHRAYLYADPNATLGTVFAWGAQLHQTSLPSTYFPVGNVYPFHGACVDGVKWFTRENPNIVVNNVVQEITGVAVPEIPYPQVLKGYTPFPAATNLLTYSGDLTNAAWTKAASVASIATYPPRLLKESLPSQLRDDSTAASIHGMFRNPTVTANTNYCAWLVVHSSGERFRGRIGFLDAATSSNGVICEFNARTGVTAAAAIGTGTLAGAGYINVAKGWGIVYVSGKIDAATTAAQFQFLLADSAGNLVYDGDGVSRMILGHFQLETGTVPTNIIPTTTAAVTVAEDGLDIPSASACTDTQGSVAASVGWSGRPPGAGNPRVVAGTPSGATILAVGTGTRNAIIFDGSAVANAFGVLPAGHHNYASRWLSGGIGCVGDGGAVATAASYDGAIVGTTTRIGGSAPNVLCEAVSFVRFWDTPLTDAELKAITANGYDDLTINTLGWVDSPQISHDGRRLYFMYSRYDFAPLLIDGAGLADLKVAGGGRGWHVAIPHPSYDADVYCAYLRHDGTVERIENMRFDPNYDDFSLQVASAESSIMEVAATASLPKRVYYNANRYGDVPKLVYRQEDASGKWTAESTAELATVSGGGSGAGYIDDNAFVSDSRLELVFASTRPGGQGSSDLWRSTRAGPTDVWGAPANIGTNINTAGHEDQVFLHPNGVDCWFTRDGGIYHCTRAGATFNNDDTLVTFTGTPLAGGIGEPSTDEAMTGLYFSYLELATRRIRIMRAPWTGSKTAWGTPVAVD